MLFLLEGGLVVAAGVPLLLGLLGRVVEVTVVALLAVALHEELAVFSGFAQVHERAFLFFA